jgi:hypothetical protein
MALPVHTTNMQHFVIPHPPEVVFQNGPYDAFTTLDDLNLAMERQFEMIHDKFQFSPFYLEWKNRNQTSISTNPNYTYFPLDYMSEMAQEFVPKDDTLTTLHVYVAFTLRSQDVPETNSFVGYSTFPSYQFQNRAGGSRNAAGDGVYVTYTALPIINNNEDTNTTTTSNNNNDNGSILIHEIGHWLGLYHTFQNGCDVHNDFVDDTPAHADSTAILSPNATCTEFVQHPMDTCPSLPGNDPAYNIMNYLADRTCLGTKATFTCGQIERMVQQWYLYRDTHDQCANSSSTSNNNSTTTTITTSNHHLEIYMLFDKLHYFETYWAFTKAEDGSILFDSVQDFANFEVPLLQDELYMDLCIEPGVYEFIVTDSSQNGFFGEAYLDITLDGVLVQKIIGNFGERSVTTIYAGTFESSTSNNSSSVVPVPTSSSSPATPSPSIVSLPTNLDSFPTSIAPTLRPSLDDTEDGWSSSSMPTAILSLTTKNSSEGNSPTTVPTDWDVVPVNHNDVVDGSSTASSSSSFFLLLAISFAGLIFLSLCS